MSLLTHTATEVATARPGCVISPSPATVAGPCDGARLGAGGVAVDLAAVLVQHNRSADGVVRPRTGWARPGPDVVEAPGGQLGGLLTNGGSGAHS